MMIKMSIESLIENDDDDDDRNVCFHNSNEMRIILFHPIHTRSVFVNADICLAPRCTDAV